MSRVASRERPADRGVRVAGQSVARVGADIRLARRNAGLSLAVVGRAARLSNAHISRLERGLVPSVSVLALGRVAAVVGLDLSIKTYPGGDPIRDAAQIHEIAAFGVLLHPMLRWATEVPLPATGDARAWDGLVAGPGWRHGVEVETQPRDAKALVRRLRLKERDGQVDGVILVLPATRLTRAFVRAAAPELRGAFPISGPLALERLRAGVDPGGSAVVVLPRRPTPRRLVQPAVTPGGTSDVSPG
jgi:transcriptional regulator with XRE-family HTH domain